MATIGYRNFTDLGTWSAYHENSTYVDLNVTEAVSTNSVPRMVNLICRPIWVITGTVGKKIRQEYGYFSVKQSLYRVACHENTKLSDCDLL